MCVLMRKRTFISQGDFKISATLMVYRLVAQERHSTPSLPSTTLTEQYSGPNGLAGVAQTIGLLEWHIEMTGQYLLLVFLSVTSPLAMRMM